MPAAGHRLLLCAAALVCSRKVYLGIAGDALLKARRPAHPPQRLHPSPRRSPPHAPRSPPPQNKTNAALLQSFGARERVATDFVLAVRARLCSVHSPFAFPRTRRLPRAREM